MATSDLAGLTPKQLVARHIRLTGKAIKAWENFAPAIAELKQFADFVEDHLECMEVRAKGATNGGRKAPGRKPATATAGAY